MLRQRVITALILAGALISTLLCAPYPAQAVLFALVAAAGGWEWAALVGAQGVLSRTFYAAIIPLLCIALWTGLALWTGARRGWSVRLLTFLRQFSP